MTPTFTLLADNQDITKAIQERLISLKLTDATGYDSDTLEIKIDDRDGKVALPRTGALLKVSLGYENQLQPMGSFVVDEIRLTGPHMTLTIAARAADFKKQLKQQKTKAWEGMTIGAIVNTIAASHELEPVVSDKLVNITIERIDQTDESDLHFLTRLGKEYDAIAKPANKRLIFAPRGEAKTASGKPMPTVTLSRNQLTTWSARLADRDKYQAVKAYYHDTNTGQRTSIQSGEGKPVYSLRNNHPDQDAAKQAAAAKLKSLNRGTGTLSLTMPGNPSIMAETPIELSGIREGINGRWVATSVTHELTSSGYVTRAESENPK